MERPGARPYSYPVQPPNRSREANNMSLIETLGPSLATILMFFGVLLLSLATAVIALLADY